MTGSHNPRDENGFKLVGEGVWPIAGDEIMKIKKLKTSINAHRAAQSKIAMSRFGADLLALDGALRPDQRRVPSRLRRANPGRMTRPNTATRVASEKPLCNGPSR